MHDPRNVTVTIADSHVAQIDDVARRLRRAGMRVDGVLATIGMITGSAPAARLAALEAVSGVAGVEEQATFRIAPPDAEVQ